ncbi:MAG: ABC transporter ATP-binding protein [Salinivirgaceae bacterium]|nr:ABC transporter ATP-binding protein [Salinivirgaceae bacterium]
MTTFPKHTKTAIKVDSISKMYPLYKSSRDRMKEALHPMRKNYHTDFYALRNVSFEIEKGESLGIIGQNGSGKSTLLKILSRVLTPTSGNFEINGRVISLLELGSGFNPELTGLENIYFYGTILGFNKKKIESKLDDILAFADIGQFVYQPLKTYSSGMRSRLGFAVASHVDPDILILDEVLAVGDMRFKQKCYRAMDSLINQKRTVVLVSHDTGSITNFCNKTLWLNEGQIQDFGPSNEIVKKYVGFMTYGLETKPKNKEVAKAKEPDIVLKSKSNAAKIALNDIKWSDVGNLESFGEYGAVIEKVALYFKDSDKRVDVVEGGEWLTLYAQISVKDNLVSPGLGIQIKEKRGNSLFTVNNYLYNKELSSLKGGDTVIIQTDIKFPLIMVGKYTMNIALSDGDQQNHIQHHWIHDAIVITVNNQDQKYKRGANIIVLDNADYNVQMHNI